ncbi:uncharacterized protein [Gossypium hirsutum]|uniref:DNA/RNA polymerases superfamily protein n=1 Tax=Gossypium hirsutum TaxID=3635 RepID=A0A1U8NPX1_GOSHI|nr:uncharacterized protein LOC107949863 [Gossypium hirsutum]
MGRGRGAPSRGAGHTEARQPILVYAARCREDIDALDVITGTFFIYNVPCTAVIDVGSMHSYIACSVSETLGIMVETTASEITVLSPLDQSVKVNRLFRDVPLEVQGTIFLGDKVVLIGERQNYLSNMISALMAEKLVRKGFEAYIAYINGVDSEAPSVKDTRTVKDFSDVFPNELHGLPPNCKVEFGIEIVPGTALVFITPYRMTLKKLVELKAQI